MTDIATNTLWRIVNPGLSPHQIVHECGEEQAALREYAGRNGHLQGFLLHKSEDAGQSWVAVPARAPDVAVPAAVSQAVASAPGSAPPPPAPPVTVSAGGHRLEVEADHAETRGSTKQHRK
jgi:hypothetical protein